MTTQREIEVAEDTVNVRAEVKGNLHVQGMEGTIVRVESSHDEPLINYADGTVQVVCRGDAVLHVPRRTHMTIEAGADLHIENLTGPVAIISSRGNVSVVGVGDLHAQEVRGDLRVAQAAGITAEMVSGNAHINDVRGAVEVNTKGDAHLHRANGSASINCKGNAHLSEINGERLSVNAKGDAALIQCRGEIAVNAAGNVSLLELVSQRVRAVAKGNIHVDFRETVGGTAKIVTGGDLHVQNGETSLRRGKGIYKFRFGQGEAELTLVSKGNTHLVGVPVVEGDLQGINEDMGSWGAEFGAEMGAEMGVDMGTIGAELGAMGAEMGAIGAEFGREFSREFGAIGRDIARQVQDKVQRKLRAKMKDLGKRTAKVEWGEGKSWSFNFGDIPTPPTPPNAPTPPAWDAPFDGREEAVEMEAGEPVSEEERALVLRMLEEGKISASEAATLLETLGDAG